MDYITGEHRLVSWLNRLFGLPVEESPVEKMIDKLPHDGEVEKVYQARWVWYHTILAAEIFFTNILLIAILIVVSVK